MASQLQILIDGEALDLALDSDTEFSLSKVVHDLRDLETRNADFSSEIVLPLTAKNRRLIGSMLPSLSRFSEAPITNKPCEILAFGIPIITDAFLTIVGEDDIAQIAQAEILGGNAKFFNQLKDEPLQELNLDAYNFEWSLADILAKGLADAESGVVVADTIWYDNPSRRTYEVKNGNDAETFLQQLELGEAGFFFYLKTMLEEIFSHLVNLTVDFNGVDSFINNKAFSCSVPIVHDSFGAVEGSFSEVNIVDLGIPLGSFIHIQYPIIVDNPEGYWNAGLFQYEFVEAGFFFVDLSVRGGYNANSLDFFIMLNADINFNNQIGRIHLEHTQGQFIPFDERIRVSVNVQAGDNLQVRVSAQTGFVIPLDFSAFSIEEQGTGRGRDFNVADMMPDISQRNFVKEVFKLLNIVPTEANNIVTLHQFDEIRNNIPIENVDIDISKASQLGNDLLTYGKTNVMKYSDNDRVERLDTTSEFFVNSALLPDKLIAVESRFSATDISEAFDVLGRCTVPQYSLFYREVNDNKMSGAAGSTFFSTLERSELEAGDLISVAGLRRRVVAMTDDSNGEVDVAFPDVFNDFDWSYWRYTSEGSGIHIAEMAQFGGGTYRDGGISQVYSPRKAATFPSTLLWNQLQDQFYSLIVSSVATPFVISAFANISVLDFITTNGLQPIYIDKYKAYFYINKLEQWKLDNSVHLELIQLEL